MTLKTIISSIKTALTTMMLVMALSAGAQTDVQLSQYYEVPAYYNPGAVGLTDLLRLRGGSRLQWVGIDNAPTSIFAVADMPLALGGKKIGVGAVVRQETLGLYADFTAAVQVGYKMKVLGGELTPALRIGMLNETFKGSKVYIPGDDDFHQPTDDAIPQNDVSGMAIDLGVGAFYSRGPWWGGLSFLHLNSPTVNFSSETGTSSGGVSEGGVEHHFTFKASPTLYFMAGGNIPVKNTLFEVMPSVMAKTDFTFTRVELTGRVRYRKFLSGGIGYRFDDAVIVLLGAEIKGFLIGYSYDYPTTDISHASSGSHELMVGYSMKLDFGEKNRHRHKSIRIM